MWQWNIVVSSAKLKNFKMLENLCKSLIYLYNKKCKGLSIEPRGSQIVLLKRWSQGWVCVEIKDIRNSIPNIQYLFFGEDNNYMKNKKILFKYLNLSYKGWINKQTNK